MFNTDNSFRDALRRAGMDRNIRHVYLAAHGDDAALYGAGDNRISRTVIGNTLDDLAANGVANLDGLFFGCCNIGNQDTIEFILSPLKSNVTIRPGPPCDEGDSVADCPYGRA